jgi:ribosomal protein S18 acetylase RimI-like enzyme
MITIREAAAADVPAIRDVFVACYGADYTDPRVYDEAQLTRLVYSEDSLTLVAEDPRTGRVVGTASVILEVGAYADLVGEFGRLAVHPDFRHRGVATRLMEERLRLVQERLQVGLVEARTDYPYAIRLAESHGFAIVGYLPQRWYFQKRESLALLARLFGGAAGLRKNHPRVIPEAQPLAHLALSNCGLVADVVVDEEAPAYPAGESFDVQELTADGYSSLLRIERGRVRNRELFGPVRLHDGVFKLRSRRSRYRIASEKGRIAGAVGFTFDPADRAARVFELIALSDRVVRFLLAQLERECREGGEVCYLEADVSAHSPRMQRTLLELGFLPVAYVPAMAFHDVERIDVVKMARLFVPPAAAPAWLSPRAAALAEVVLSRFQVRAVLPRIAGAVRHLALFAGLDGEQVDRLAGVARHRAFEPGQVIFREGERGEEIHLILDGEVSIVRGGAAVGAVGKGECLGEMALLTGAAHSATATARTAVETAELRHPELSQLIRQRPDVGLHIFRNLAVGLGGKLERAGVLG